MNILTCVNSLWLKSKRKLKPCKSTLQKIKRLLFDTKESQKYLSIKITAKLSKLKQVTKELKPDQRLSSLITRKLLCYKQNDYS